MGTDLNFISARVASSMYFTVTESISTGGFCGFINRVQIKAGYGTIT